MISVSGQGEVWSGIKTAGNQKLEGLAIVTAVAFYFHRLSRSGGAERMICRVAAELSGRGLDVHLLSLDSADAQSFYAIGREITWHRLGLSSGPTGKVRRVRRMVAIMRQHGVRVLIGFVMSGDKTVYAASKIAKVRLVAAERNGPSIYRLRYGRRHRWLSFALLQLCDSIVVQFPEYIYGYPKFLRKRMTCIGNPVGAACTVAMPECPGDDGRFQLLAVSRLDGIQKRLDCLIQAFGLIAQLKPEWDLKIIGEGSHEAALCQIVADLGLIGRVTFEGPTERVDEIYARANLFVMPSRWEGFPNALAEAMSAGLPAVGFRNAEGVAQLITDGASGWLAGPGDATSALAEALAQAMSDGKERRRRGTLAIWEMSRYAPPAQNDRWFALVDQLANGNSE